MPEVAALFIAARRGASPQSTTSIDLIAGAGIAGDRYCDPQSSMLERPAAQRATEVTFVAAEEIDAFNANQGLTLEYGDLRRNIVTRGVDLNALVGQRFHMGEVEFEGIELCEPCSRLAKTVSALVLPHLVHRAGLRAAVLSSGCVRVNDAFEN